MSRAPSPIGVTSANERIARHSAGACLRRRDDLDAVLARVARAGDQSGNRVEGRLADGEAGRRLPVVAGELAHDADRLRALKSDERRPVGLVDEFEVCRSVSTQPGEVDLVVGRVGDDQVLEIARVVHDQVVDDVAVFIEHERVLGTTEFGDLGAGRW